MDFEFLEAVASDLAFLEEHWDAAVDEQSLRRSSGVLRNLLIEDWFAKAWRALGQPGQPDIEAVDLESAIAGYDVRRINFASAGGGESQGMTIAGALFYEGAVPAEALNRSSHPPMRTFRLSKFREATSLVIAGQRIKRGDVVKFVANKLGGAHFDRRRKQSATVYGLMDQARTQVSMAGKSLVYFELVSIGQAVARADSARHLRDLIENALPSGR